MIQNETKSKCRCGATPACPHFVFGTPDLAEQRVAGRAFENTVGPRAVFTSSTIWQHNKEPQDKETGGKEPARELMNRVYHNMDAHRHPSEHNP